MKKLVISAFAASLVMGGATFAYADQSSQNTQTRNSAAAYGVGTAQANRDGAQAGAIVGGEAKQMSQTQRKNKRNKGGQHEGHNMGGQQGGQMTSPNAASTFTNGAAYTDRNRATAAGSTGGSAAGTGVQSTTSGLSVAADVFQDGGSATVDGGSTATSGERPKRQRNP